MLSGNALFKGLTESTYLSKMDTKPRWMIRMFLRIKVMRGTSEKKMQGRFPIIYCDYADNLKLSSVKYINLPMLSRKEYNPLIESYFTGYEGLSEGIRTDSVIPEIVKLFERYYIIFRNMIDEHHIKAFVLTGIIGIYESAILQLSIDKNIPVFVVQHGLYIRLFPDKRLLKNVKFFASGMEEFNILRDCGILADNIFMTGSPFFDGVVEHRIDSVLKNKYILILSQPLDDNEIDVCAYKDCLEAIINKYKGSKIIVKLHPRESNRKLYNSIGFDVVCSNSKSDLYRLIASAKLVIGFESTAELEAMMIGVPVLTMDHVRHNPFPYKYKQYSLDKCSCGMQKKYINDNFILDGKSQERIENILKAYQKG